VLEALLAYSFMALPMAIMIGDLIRNDREGS
jgi:hypothetical protein